MRTSRRYTTVFRFPETGAQVSFETIGETPCMAKNLGWYLLTKHLREHPDLPADGWVIDQNVLEGVIPCTS